MEAWLEGRHPRPLPSQWEGSQRRSTHVADAALKERGLRERSANALSVGQRCPPLQVTYGAAFPVLTGVPL